MPRSNWESPSFLPSGAGATSREITSAKQPRPFGLRSKVGQNPARWWRPEWWRPNHAPSCFMPRIILLQESRARSNVNSRCTYWRAFSATRSSSMDSRTLGILSAIDSAELSFIKNPVSPSVITSGMPPTAVARTGVPQAIASSITFGSPSVYDGITSSLSSFRRSGSAVCSIQPVTLTRLPNPDVSTYSRTGPTSGPSPTTTNSSVESCLIASGMALTNCRMPFS